MADRFNLPHRPRRMRRNQAIRDMVQETQLGINDLVMPLFIAAGNNIKNEIGSMPGIFQYSLDRIDEELEILNERGLTRVLLFGIPHKKDAEGSDTFSPDGIIQNAIRHIKARYPHFYVITDICFCEYTDHGHCGVLTPSGELDNDATLRNLQRQAISHAKAGADMVAPSGMIDGMIYAMRTALDQNGFSALPIMSYAVKYASAFYGPFRDAVDSSPQSGDRRAYQMDYSNAREALYEATLDYHEGADILMVKPALAYLDIIQQLKAQFNLPIACYNVSGEYSMIKAAAQKGWIDETATILESLTAMKRAGADIIITYFARDIAVTLNA